MAMKLYELAEMVSEKEKLLEEWAEEHDGDFTEFPFNDELDQMSGTLEERVLGMADWITNLLAEAAMVKAEKAKLAKRQSSLEKLSERLTNYLGYCIPVGVEYSNGRHQIVWKKATELLYNVPVEDLPNTFLKIEMKPQKTLIRKELKLISKEAEGGEMEIHSNYPELGKMVYIGTKQVLKIK